LALVDGAAATVFEDGRHPRPLQFPEPLSDATVGAALQDLLHQGHHGRVGRDAGGIVAQRRLPAVATPLKPECLALCGEAEQAVAGVVPAETMKAIVRGAPVSRVNTWLKGPLTPASMGPGLETGYSSVATSWRYA